MEKIYYIILNKYNKEKNIYHNSIYEFKNFK